MAKLTIEEAKLKLQNETQPAIEGLTKLGLAIPPSLQQDFDRYTKIINGNASANVANTFNEKIAAQINKSPEFVELLASQIGTRAKLSVVVKTAEDGTKSIAFEASTNSGGQKSGTSTGTGTKAPTAYNHYAVAVTGDLPEYATKEAVFESASKAVEFILNGGKNPLNKGAEYGKGNSMVRVLQSLSKEEAFTKNFTLECSYVAVEKKSEATTEATA